MVGSRVYIGGLPYGTNERDLERFFRGYGRMREITIKSGYGFVEFEDYRDADDAVYELNGKRILGERVTVERARGTPRGRDRWGDSSSSGSRGRDRDRGSGRDRYGPPTRTAHRVIVENLSSRVSWQDLKDYMRQAGEVTYADAHREHKNEGVVEFASRSDMKNAVEKLDDTELNDLLTLSPSDKIYHEKQVRELCALHALNNLFQEKNAFLKSELDSICYGLSPENWINPHKSILGLGNYDVNVIMSALQARGYDMVWFDKRKDPQCLNFDNIVGLILNIPSDYKISFITIPLKRRHWIAIRKLNGLFYNLDSKLSTPTPIGSEKDLLSFLRVELDTQDRELFVVVTDEVGKSEQWLKEPSSYNNKVIDSSSRDAEEVCIGDINGTTN